MSPCVTLVVILLTLVVFACAQDFSSLDSSQDQSRHSSWLKFSSSRDDSSKKLKRRPLITTIYSPGKVEIIRTRNKIATKGAIKRKGNTKGPKVTNNVTTKTNKLELIHNLSANPKTDLETRESKRKSKKRMNQAMMALLLAYKLKFATLIPTMIGGLIILTSTTALAGFFFALFAAVLGLKTQ